MHDGLNQLGEFLEKAEGPKSGPPKPGPQVPERSGNPAHSQYTYDQPSGEQGEPIGQTDTGAPIHAVERGPHSVDAWGEVLVGKTLPGHEQSAPRHLEHDGKHWIRAGFNSDSNTVGYHEYQPARHLLDPTTGFAREAVPVDAKGVAGGVFHVAGLPEHGGGDLPSEINDPHHGKLTVRGFNSDSGMTLYHKDIHNPGWNRPGSTGEANGKAAPPGATPPPQEGQNAPVAPPIRGALPQGGQPPALQPGQPTVGGQPGKPPMPPTTGPQTAPKPPLPGGPGAQQPPAIGQQQMRPGSSPQMPLLGQGQPPRPPVAGSPQASPQGQPGAQAMPPKPPMPGQPPAPGQVPTMGRPPAPAGMKPPMAGPAGSPPAGIQPAGPKPITPSGTPLPMGRQTGGVPGVPSKPGQPAQAATMKPPVPGAPPAPPVKPAVGAKKNPFEKSMGLEALGDWMEKAGSGGHKYTSRTGVSGSYKYTYADDNRTHHNSPNPAQLDRQLPGTKVTMTTGGNKGVHFTRQDDGTWRGDGNRLDSTSLASLHTFGNQVVMDHPVGPAKEVGPNMHVIAKDGSGAFIVSIGDPTKGESKLKRRFSGPTAESDLRDWVRDNVGDAMSHNHIMDTTGKDLVPKYHHPDYPAGKGPKGKAVKRDVGGRESLDFTATAENAKNMSDRELDAALKDIQATLESADKLDREQGTDRGGLYRDEASVYHQELARRAKGKKGKAKKEGPTSRNPDVPEGVDVGKFARERREAAAAMGDLGMLPSDKKRQAEKKPATPQLSAQSSEHNQSVQFLQNLGKLGVHVMKFPSGKFGFVGSVPGNLSYERKDGQPLTEQDARDIRQAGPGFVSHVKTRVFDSQEEALAVAQKLGIGVSNAPKGEEKPKTSSLSHDEVDNTPVGGKITNDGGLQAERLSDSRWKLTFPDGREQEAHHSRVLPSKGDVPWHRVEGSPASEAEAATTRAGQARESMKGFAGYSQVKKYVNSIRNPHKKAYAQAYAQWMAEGEKTGQEPAEPKELGTMGRQAVRLHLDNLKSEAIAPVETEKMLGKVAKRGADKAKAKAKEASNPKDITTPEHQAMYEKNRVAEMQNKEHHENLMRQNPVQIGAKENVGPYHRHMMEGHDAAVESWEHAKNGDHDEAALSAQGAADAFHRAKNAAPVDSDQKRLALRAATAYENHRLAHEEGHKWAKENKPGYQAKKSPEETSSEGRAHKEVGTYSDPSAAHERAMKLKQEGWGNVRIDKTGKGHAVSGTKPQQLKLFGKSLDGLNSLGDFLKKSEKIPGGLAAGKGPEDFDSQALAQGQKVELEHADNPLVAREIAMDHLTEDPHYYTKLAKMEAEKVEKCGMTKALPGRGATEKCMNKAMNGLEALSGYLSKSLEDPMPDEKCELGYGKSREVGESPDGGDIDGKGASRSMEGRVGDAHGGAGGQKADVGGAPSLDKDKLNKEERDPEDQMSPGKTAIEVSEKSLTPAGQRSMVAKEHALKVQELTKSTDVQVGVPDHPYMMSSMGDVDAATEGLLKSDFYQGESPTLSQPGTMLRKSVLCKSEACGISYPAFYTACPECGNGQTTNRLMPHSHEIGGEGPTRLEKSKNDPILQPRPQEDDLMVGAPENVVLFRTRR